MLKYLFIGSVAVVALAIAGLSLVRDDARSATTGHLTLNVTSFRGVDYSKHNDQGGGSNACGAYVPLDDPYISDEAANERGELAGGTDGNWRGSFLHSVTLPHGATPTGVSIIANDNSEGDVHVFLMRKQITDGLEPAKKGYLGIAHARTDGAENGILQKVTDSTVKGGNINNLKFEYFAELIICDTTEPYAVQISYTTP